MWYKNSYSEWFNLSVFCNFYIDIGENKSAAIFGSICNDCGSSQIECNFKTSEEAQTFLDTLINDLTSGVVFLEYSVLKKQLVLDS